MTNKSSEKVKKKSKFKGLLLAGVGIAVLVGAGSGVGFYFAQSSHAEDGEKKIELPKLVERTEGEAEPAEGEKGEAPARVGTVEVKSDRIRPDPKKYAIAYVPIEENFTSNLAGGVGFIQISLSLATYYDDTVVSNIKRQMTPIRSAILLVLSEQDPEFVSTSAGKEALQVQLTKVINEVLREQEGFGGIDNVYFSNLVIQ